MRTITTETTVYSFDELTEEGKEKAIERYGDINIKHDWWDAIYEDASNIGLKITGFDLDRNRHATGAFTTNALEVAEKIIEEHGDQCDTYATASNYLFDREKLVKRYSDGNNIDQVTEENEYDFDQECDDLDSEFLRSLLEDYSIMLQNESEYLTSSEQISETLVANEYEFTEDGRIF